MTLAETLTTTAILTLLAGTLLPVLSQAREQGRAVVCVSNARQLGLAFRLYTDDWDRYPGAALARRSHAGDWVRMEGGTRISTRRGSLYRYTRHTGIYRCPSAPGPLAFAMNRALDHLPAQEVTRPASTVLLVEQQPHGPHSLGVNDGWFDARWSVDRVTDRHHARGTLLYCDGHTARALPATVDARTAYGPPWMP